MNGMWCVMCIVRIRKRKVLTNVYIRRTCLCFPHFALIFDSCVLAVSIILFRCRLFLGFLSCFAFVSVTSVHVLG